MSQASRADFLIISPEEDVVCVLRQAIDVALDPVEPEGPNCRVDTVVVSGPVDFRELRAHRPRQMATNAEKYPGVGEFETQPPHPKGLRGTAVSSPGGLVRRNSDSCGSVAIKPEAL